MSRLMISPNEAATILAPRARRARNSFSSSVTGAIAADPPAGSETGVVGAGVAGAGAATGAADGFATGGGVAGAGLTGAGAIGFVAAAGSAAAVCAFSVFFLRPKIISYDPPSKD